MLVNKDPTSYKASFSSSSKGGKLMWKNIWKKSLSIVSNGQSLETLKV